MEDFKKSLLAIIDQPAPPPPEIRKIFNNKNQIKMKTLLIIAVLLMSSCSYKQSAYRPTGKPEITEKKKLGLAGKEAQDAKIIGIVVVFLAITFNANLN